MAENETTTKVEDQHQGELPEGASEDLLSLDSLDSIISEVDPEFSQALGEIGTDDSANIEIYSEDISLEYTLADEVKLWKETPGRRQKLLRLFPFLPRIFYFYKVKRLILRLKLSNFKEQAIYRTKNARPLLLAWIKHFVGSFRSQISDAFTTIGTFSGLKKMAFLGVLLATGPAIYVAYKASTTGLFPHHQELFAGSMEDWSQKNYFFEPGKDVDSFYESTRTSQNILLMKKMVVNLRRSSGANTTPMGAFEFYLEGTSAEVVIEIKDREPEMEDLILSTIEEMTYDQMATGEGKQLLCDRLKREINKVLTKGFVRRVFIKTAIIKP